MLCLTGMGRRAWGQFSNRALTGRAQHQYRLAQRHIISSRTEGDGSTGLPGRSRRATGHQRKTPANRLGGYLCQRRRTQAFRLRVVAQLYARWGRREEAVRAWQEMTTQLGYEDITKAIGDGYARGGYESALPRVRAKTGTTSAGVMRRFRSGFWPRFSFLEPSYVEDACSGNISINSCGPLSR